ncbi:MULTISPECIES: molybdopterin cofactor-binding domain-containing protein [Bradyrhizobium]|jgi:isoquinoline 1-oxidoreductase beta subunit|uniref:Molybdopterin-dependent oxidoreductase n=2 Tax=Bradyrhizobium TaxID=374 RepID=A0ABS5GHS4_9BRAD|nr:MULTISPECIES: molybdopterin cofactor-binding domain-containing protein [Bradyrhizobium]MBR1140819.1 molybdopterin-dependent oxidoreductase [Bradyrhizobium denitrificans]MDU1496515.1 molybdopterin cofactor-binding domain-containing protein [Bradyrhizobium sp.]MDU1546798.1 molybdopterin cofactor-binding domain-containing protein [Bradyrhizobium sp.]MDU1689049.1 molybdopterin cofactor-binding domain-containing protein [Bradyrhizobium sp.]MDU1805374.1 molybdopterin cofactor-binding domain-conta
MDIAQGLSRRSFLVGSAALAGGVAFGGYGAAVQAAETASDNPLAAGLARDAVTFNPWVEISAGKITLIAQHADIGQGTGSVQPMMIAEEMDLDPGQFEIRFAGPHPAYFNTGFKEELAPFLAADQSPAAEKARAAALEGLRKSGLQMTGGSSTIPDTYEKLRVAGAVARETLKLAAAKRTGAPLADLRTQSGHVVLPNGSRIAYVDLAADAARIPPVVDAKPRDPSTWRILGKPMMRLDIRSKVLGELKFGIDMKMDGMLYAAVKLNPNKGQPLKSFNAARAQTMPGVKTILRLKNGVAAVATNSWYAMKAVETIDCEWAPSTYPAEQADHWKTLEGSFKPEFLGKEWRKIGDVEAGLKQGKRVEAEYRAPYVGHQPLEPLNGVALVTDLGMEIWVGHQSPQAVQAIAAANAGLKPEQVTFHNQWTGGSFGHRLEFENVRVLAEIASQMRGTPIKLVFSREEDFRQDIPRQISIARHKGSVAKGRIISADLKLAGTMPYNGLLEHMGMPTKDPDPQLAAGLWNVYYDIPHFRATTFEARNLSPCTTWRSVGASTGGFFTESFIDEMIHAAGLDPMKARIEMCAVPTYRKVLETVAEMSDWKGPLGQGRGRGVAFVESFGTPVAEVVDVTVTPRGIRVDKVFVAVDVGKIIDPVNFESQVQGGVVWGLGHAMNCELTYAKGGVQQTNYNHHEAMRMYQCPVITVRGLQNDPKVRGLGEPPVPPVAPALANAIFAATGKRIREMPFNKFIEFV